MHSLRSSTRVLSSTSWAKCRSSLIPSWSLNEQIYWSSRMLYSYPGPRTYATNIRHTHSTACNKQKGTRGPVMDNDNTARNEQMQPDPEASIEVESERPKAWEKFPVEQPAWPGALAEEWKDYPWADDTEYGEDTSLVLPFRQHAEGMELIRQHAVVAMRRLERARWVYLHDTQQIIRRPDPQLWRKYHLAPGDVSIEGDDYDVGSAEQVCALKAKWKVTILDEIRAEEDRKLDPSYDPTKDGFYYNVFHGIASEEEPAVLRCYARMLATADRSVHKKAFFDMGWLRAQTIACKQNEAAAGFRLSTIEKARRHYQCQCDYDDNEEAWLLHKDIEMQKWNAIEQDGLQVQLDEGEEDKTANLKISFYL